MADSLYELIDHARREMPEIPDHAWKKFERIVRRNFGTTRLYIAAPVSYTHLVRVQGQCLHHQRGRKDRHARRRPTCRRTLTCQR